MGRKGLRADDGVVTPVVAVAAHPGREARGDDGAVDPGGELLEPGEERVAIDDEGQRLDDAGIRIRFHRDREAHDAFAGHQAVRIEDEHVIVVPAPAAHEIGDVARLAVVVLRPVPVVEARVGSEPVPQFQERALLRDPGVGIGGIGDDEIVEGASQSGRVDGFPNGFDGGEGSCRLLVVDRHDDRRPARQCFGQCRRRRRPPEKSQEADESARARERDPREIDGEEGEQHPLQDGRAAHRHDLIHLVGTVGGQQQGASEDEEARKPGRVVRARGRRTPLLRLRPAPQRLGQHLEVLFRRHGGFGPLERGHIGIGELTVSNDRAMFR